MISSAERERLVPHFPDYSTSNLALGSEATKRTLKVIEGAEPDNGVVPIGFFTAVGLVHQTEDGPLLQVHPEGFAD